MEGGRLERMTAAGIARRRSKEREDATARQRIHPGDKLFILGFLLWLFCRNCATAHPGKR